MKERVDGLCACGQCVLVVGPSSLGGAMRTLLWIVVIVVLVVVALNFMRRR